MQKEKKNEKHVIHYRVIWRLLKWIHKQLNALVFRVQVLKVVVVSVFLMLLVNIYVVHVIHADDYVAFNALTTTTYLNREVPRGIIYDRNMVPLAVNTAVPVITYRHLPNTYVGTIRELATNLAQLIEVEHDGILTYRDLQELFIFENEEEARALVLAEEADTLDNAAFHQAMIDRITDEHLETLTDEQRQIHLIFTRMHQGAGTTTNIIKKNPTEEEIARVTENMMHLSGIEVGVDWARDYPSELGHSAVLGNISTHQTGIPREREAYFLAQGYAANARVGISQIEWAMQSELSGFQSRYFIEDGVATQVAQGLPGFQISLNLDTELQMQIEEIVAQHLRQARSVRTSQNVREAYVVLTNPNTGAVLSMVGVVLSTDGQITYNPLGTFQNSFNVGSVVKGATLMAGYYHDATHVGQVRLDVPIRIQGSNDMASWRTEGLGYVNEIQALSMSSNVYFWRQTMELAGVTHTQGGPVQGWANDNDIWDYYRDFFANVGLGTLTGIELQNEGIGFQAQSREFYNILHFAIGQSDTYTAMQLAQFIGVIATNGNRMQMQLVQDVYMPGDEGEERQLVRGFEPNLLNRIELTDSQWRNIHEGHRRAVQQANEGTGYNAFNRDGIFDFRPAGKTGTAEDILRDADGNPLGIDTLNRTFIGYAPWDDPEVAISVIVPQSQTPNSPSSSISEDIARDVLEAYFDLQADRENQRD